MTELYAKTASHTVTQHRPDSPTTSSRESFKITRAPRKAGSSEITLVQPRLEFQEISAFGYGSSRRKFKKPQIFQIFGDEEDDSLWHVSGPFGVRTHENDPNRIRDGLEDYLAYLWRTYVESDEPMTNSAAQIRRELLEAVVDG